MSCITVNTNIVQGSRIAISTNVVQGSRIDVDSSVVCPVDEGGAWYRFDVQKLDGWRKIK